MGASARRRGVGSTAAQGELRPASHHGQGDDNSARGARNLTKRRSSSGASRQGAEPRIAVGLKSCGRFRERSHRHGLHKPGYRRSESSAARQYAMPRVASAVSHGLDTGSAVDPHMRSKPLQADRRAGLLAGGTLVRYGARPCRGRLEHDSQERYMDGGLIDGDGGFMNSMRSREFTGDAHRHLAAEAAFEAIRRGIRPRESSRRYQTRSTRAGDRADKRCASHKRLATAVRGLRCQEGALARGRGSKIFADGRTPRMRRWHGIRLTAGVPASMHTDAGRSLSPTDQRAYSGTAHARTP